MQLYYEEDHPHHQAADELQNAFVQYFTNALDQVRCLLQAARCSEAYFVVHFVLRDTEDIRSTLRCLTLCTGSLDGLSAYVRLSAIS